MKHKITILAVMLFGMFESVRGYSQALELIPEERREQLRRQIQEAIMAKGPLSSFAVSSDRDLGFVVRIIHANGNKEERCPEIEDLYKELRRLPR